MSIGWAAARRVARAPVDRGFGDEHAGRGRRARRMPQSGHPRHRPGQGAPASAAVPSRASGGVALDLTALRGVLDIRRALAARACGRGDLRTGAGDLAADPRIHGGHFPQSFDLSTVGGWVACRGAGPVLDALREDRGHGAWTHGRAGGRHGRRDRRARVRARPSGRTSHSCSSARRVTLGVITEVELVDPSPPPWRRRAGVQLRHVQRRTRRMQEDPRAGRDACRPAPVRRRREHQVTSSVDRSVLVVLDEADPALLEATLAVVDEECETARERGRRAGRHVARTPQRRLRTRRRSGRGASSSTRWRSLPHGAGSSASTAMSSTPWPPWRGRSSPRSTSPTPTSMARACTSRSSGTLRRTPTATTARSGTPGATRRSLRARR